MSLTRTLTIGASSLQAHQQKFDVISNNLANANTTAYKANRANFQEQFNQVYKYGNSPTSVAGDKGLGGRNPLQFGLGVKLGAVQQDMSQGALESTNRTLDLALQGDGFFIFSENGRDKFSRAGAITQDRNGYLIDSASGSHLQGYNVSTDENGRITKDANGINTLSGVKQDLLISPSTISSPRQTENVNLTGNLKSSNPEGEVKRSSITVFDNLGNSHELRINFTKTENPNEYSILAELNGGEVALSENLMTFNNDGTLNSPLQIAVTADELNTLLNSESFASDLNITLANSTNLTSGITNYGMNNSVYIDSQDGWQAGSLLDVDIDPNGVIRGIFSNGRDEVLGQILMAKFANEEGLVRTGDNFYAPTPNSGLPNIGTAGTIFPSTKITNFALEMSNVDMTKQFTDMISTQRGFEAAARSITVNDQMLAETMMLKR